MIKIFALSEHICSNEFVADVRHVLAPQAFTRNRKLPLPKLIAALLSMRSSAVQFALDSFFGSLGGNGDVLGRIFLLGDGCRTGLLTPHT